MHINTFPILSSSTTFTLKSILVGIACNNVYIVRQYLWDLDSPSIFFPPEGATVYDLYFELLDVEGSTLMSKMENN